ncbi:hypothetical protein MXD81_01155 [Microbacteriaceae bacterium K1510]|nr:hypothetical protein [Microbacteriaceae bacterium K1510]
MKRSWIAAALMTLAASAAQAEPPASEAFAKSMFGKGITANDKAYACFVRRYDAAHLARHPEQKVKAMILLVTGETKVTDPEEFKEVGPYSNYVFRVAVRLRDRAGAFESNGYCGHPRVTEEAPGTFRLSCGVDCDGGGIGIEMAGNDKSTMVSLSRMRIWQKNNRDDEGADLNGGTDDRLFRLDRADIEDCASLITDRDELTALRRRK